MAPPVVLTPEQIEFQKKVEAVKKELTTIANFISNKGLKQKIGMFNMQ
jgi:hypothetical protein